MATVANRLIKTIPRRAVSNQNRRIHQDNQAWKDTVGLKERVRDFLERQSVKTIADIQIRGVSGVNYHIDFFVHAGRGYKPHANKNIDQSGTPIPRGLGIFVKDYIGPAKVTNIIQAERARKDCPEISKVLVISNTFSGPSTHLADRSGVVLLSLGEIVSTYLNEGWPI